MKFIRKIMAQEAMIIKFIYYVQIIYYSTTQTDFCNAVIFCWLCFLVHIKCQDEIKIGLLCCHILL